MTSVPSDRRSTVPAPPGPTLKEAILGRLKPLDLHEELCDPRADRELSPVDGTRLWEPVPHGPLRDPRAGCIRWREDLGLVSSHGELVWGRCCATNQCEYCAKLAAIENTEMLALDAMVSSPPEVWAVLTTRTATLDMALFYRARAQVIKALRRRWPCEYASLLEFTTGYGPRSGGGRRPHWNLLLKGISALDLKTCRRVALGVWCDRVDAHPAGQHVGLVNEAGGLMRYIALHFQKESQTPPPGFRGQRFNCSRNYFADRTRAEMREDARLSLRDKRDLWKALQLGIEDPDVAEDWIDARYASEGLPDWGIYQRPLRKEWDEHCHSRPAAIGVA